MQLKSDVFQKGASWVIQGAITNFNDKRHPEFQGVFFIYRHFGISDGN